MVDNSKKTVTELRVVDQNENVVFVEFPSLDIPVKMTNQYFEQLRESGEYEFIFDLTKASVA